MYVGTQLSSPAALHALYSMQGSGGCLIGHANPQAYLAAVLGSPDGQAVLDHWRDEPARLKAAMEEHERINATNPPRYRQRRSTRAGWHRQFLNVADVSPCWSTACHEAGHAAAGCVYGFSIKAASIKPEGNSAGHVGFYDLAKHSPLNVAAMCFAGPMAAAKGTKQEASAGRLYSDGDLAICRDALHRYMGDDMRHWLYGRARDLAEKFVTDRWPAIDALARELVVGETLTAADIARIVQSN